MKLSRRIISSVRRIQHGDLTYRLKDNKDLTSKMTSSILSYCENKTLMEQGITMDDLPMYRYYKKLHELTNIRKLTDAGEIRVGQDGDGGYVMADFLSREKIAYSIGIGSDVSWDRQMADAGYEVYMYDHTIRKCPEENSRFHWRKIGIGGVAEPPKIMTFEDMLKANRHLDMQGMVLKMDVEGAEWDVLDLLSEDILRKFDQIVMELHGLLDVRNAKKILRGLEKLSRSHEVIHIHGNNLSRRQFTGNLITPNCIEITYVLRGQYQTERCDGFLPTALDFPVSVKLTESMLGKWNV